MPPMWMCSSMRSITSAGNCFRWVCHAANVNVLKHEVHHLGRELLQVGLPCRQCECAQA